MNNRSFLRVAPVTLVSLLAVACGSSVSSTNAAGGAGGGATSTSTANGGAGGGVTSTTATSSGGAGGGVTSTSTTASGGAGGGVTSTTASGGAGGGTTTTTTGTACGGKMGKPCAADEYCDYGDNRCGVADGGGTCTKRPQNCPDNYQPTCGCDGVVHSSPCDTNASGVDVNQNGCEPPSANLFACGPGFCDVTTEYCVAQLSDIGNEPDSFGCKPLPAACVGAGTCPCVAAEPCGDLCEVTGAGVRVTCPGG
jgi:hypothetical protein